MMAMPGRSTIAVAALLGACGRVPPPRAPSPAGAPAQAVIASLAGYEAPNAALVVGRLFPIGWSPDGRFAYAYEPPDEACGCYTLEVVVRDLRTGDVRWLDRYDSGELRVGDATQLRSIDDVWRARGEDYRRHLREQGIDEPAGHELVAIATGGADRPRVEIDTTEVGDDSDVGFAHLASYRVDAVTDGGRRTILSSRPEGIGPLAVEVAGYLPGPSTSSLAAVVIVEHRRGWEGTPHVAELRVGAAELGPR